LFSCFIVESPFRIMNEHSFIILAKKRYSCQGTLLYPFPIKNRPFLIAAGDCLAVCPPVTMAKAG
jgi:hypothetical protein